MLSHGADRLGTDRLGGDWVVATGTVPARSPAEGRHMSGQGCLLRHLRDSILELLKSFGDRSTTGPVDQLDRMDNRDRRPQGDLRAAAEIARCNDVGANALDVVDLALAPMTVPDRSANVQRANG